MKFSSIACVAVKKCWVCSALEGDMHSAECSFVFVFFSSNYTDMYKSFCLVHQASCSNYSLRWKIVKQVGSLITNMTLWQLDLVNSVITIVGYMCDIIGNFDFQLRFQLHFTPLLLKPSQHTDLHKGFIIKPVNNCSRQFLESSSTTVCRRAITSLIWLHRAPGCCTRYACWGRTGCHNSRWRTSTGQRSRGSSYMLHPRLVWLLHCGG